LVIGTDERQRCLRVLALASTGELAERWRHWDPAPAVELVRGPEAGIVMVRGRIGGGGDRFNLGEATVARATVRLHGAGLRADAIGTSYVLGTDLEHARLGAIFDALLQDEAQCDRVLGDVIAPLQAAQDERDAVARAEARGTLVDFFTVAREHE
jgi:alpha-D-ribose 1-methylphosphonate 5-triphosphate synthase subunit PhnG